MNRRSAALLLPLLLAGAAPARASHQPPFTITATYTDMTPDPTGNAQTMTLRCDGVLPQEPPLTFQSPDAGVLRIELAGFTGDWALVVRNSTGFVIAVSDVNPPAYEIAAVRLSAGTYYVQPCNLAGTFDATVTMSYRYLT